jgi:hypothetical protein
MRRQATTILLAAAIGVTVASCGTDGSSTGASSHPGYTGHDLSNGIPYPCQGLGDAALENCRRGGMQWPRVR